MSDETPQGGGMESLRSREEVGCPKWEAGCRPKTLPLPAETEEGGVEG